MATRLTREEAEEIAGRVALYTALGKAREAVEAARIEAKRNGTQAYDKALLAMIHELINMQNLV